MSINVEMTSLMFFSSEGGVGDGGGCILVQIQPDAHFIHLETGTPGVSWLLCIKMVI